MVTKAVFAARDPSGNESLWYSFGPDGSVSFASHPFLLEGFEDVNGWNELPPGHFIAGKPPRVQQFALTPEQLQEREYMESLEDEYPMSLSSAVPAGASLERLLSKEVERFSGSSLKQSAEDARSVSSELEGSLDMDNQFSVSL